MKKFMMAAVALICMTMTSVALISCGDDDDDNGSSGSGSKATTAVLDFTFSASDETLAVLDVIAEYYDANGKLQNEKLTQNTLKKTVKGTLPAYLGARLLFNVKSGVDAASLDKVNVTYSFEYGAYFENTKGEKSAYTPEKDNIHITMSGNKLENWVSRNSGLVKFGFDYTADGQVVNSGWKER